MEIFKRILVATDFSETSERALELALDLATRLGSQLTLVHIWEFPSYEYLDGVPKPSGYADQIGEAAKARMASTLNTIKARCPNAQSIVRMGLVWPEVLRAVEDSNADLLVLGTHGRRGLMRAILGSVAEKLVRSSSVPVLTVHGSEKSA